MNTNMRMIVNATTIPTTYARTIETSYDRNKFSSAREPMLHAAAIPPLTRKAVN